MAAFEGAKHFASRKKAEWHEKRAAGEIPAQAEIEMEEEATIEEKIVKAMPIEKKVDEKKIHEQVNTTKLRSHSKSSPWKYNPNTAIKG